MNPTLAGLRDRWAQASVGKPARRRLRLNPVWVASITMSGIPLGNPMTFISWLRFVSLTAALLMLPPALRAQTPSLTPDIPARFDVPDATYDYVKRVAMIPMRDGVKLYTVIVIPKNARNAPIILTRTPYNAAKRAERIASPHMLAILPQGDEVFVADG